jgi:hypothetical protein
MRKHLTFARREGRQPLFERVQLGLGCTCQAVHLDGIPHSRQQILVNDGLGQEINRTSLHGPHTRRNIAASGDEDDGPRAAGSRVGRDVALSSRR